MISHQNTELALQESEEKFRLVTENPIIGIAWANNNGYVIDANDAFCKILQYDLNEIKGLNFSVFTHPDDVLIENELIAQILSGKINHYKIEKRYLSKKREIIWVELNLSCYKNAQGEIKYFIGIIVDISARKKAEAALESSKEQYKFITEIVPQMFWTSDSDGSAEYFNNKFYEYTGIKFEEAEGWGWQRIIHPGDVQKCMKKWLDCIRTGVAYEMEFRIKRASDNMYRWHLSRALPLKDSASQIIKWFGTSTDIHEQKEMMESFKIKNKELIKTNNDLDNFVYTASHNLKSPVLNIEGLLTALQELLEEESLDKIEVNEVMQMILLSTQKLKDTIQDLSEIGRTNRNIAEDIEEINIGEIMDDVRIMLFREIESSQANIDLNFDSCPKINFSRTDLKSILYNLLSNAIKYRNPNKPSKINISTFSEKEYSCLRISDNGLGLPEEKKDLIFGMFKRFHTHVPGSGIGLYIVKRILDNNEGKVEVETKEGLGMTFKIYFKNKGIKGI